MFKQSRRSDSDDVILSIVQYSQITGVWNDL